MRFFFILLLAVSVIVIVGCRESSGGGHSHGPDAAAVHSHDDEEVSVAVTRWTENMELFMEYPPLVRGESLDFTVHLTVLHDFKPVTGGLLMLEFTPEQGGTTFTVRERDLVVDGIFAPIVFFSNTGNYRFSVRYKNENLSDRFDMGLVTVVENATEFTLSEEDLSGEEISFLKEQQWKTQFGTEQARLKMVKPSVRASAEVLPHQLGHIAVISPVAGVISVGSNKTMAFPGQTVKPGQTLAVLAPPYGGDGGWTQARLAFEQAKKQYERAQRMIKKDAISRQEYEILNQRYEILKSGFSSLGRSGRAGGSYFSIAAPGGGVVSQVNVRPGELIPRGQNIMTIVDASKVWLKVNLFQKDYYKLKEPAGIEVHFPGLDTPLYLNPEDMNRVSAGEVLDAISRTIPLIFEMQNPDNTFKIGQVLRARLYIQKEQQAVCVPREAVYDDEGNQVVFVQLAGESFEKREIKTGPESFGWVSVLSGLKVGERVVTKGAYLVKLAGTSTPIGHGHTH